MSVRYRSYIASPEWAKRRQRWFRKNGRYCRACARPDHLHLHHVTYDRLAMELDSDLVALCDPCHSAVHQYHRMMGGTLQEATNRFIENTRSSCSYEIIRDAWSKQRANRLRALRGQTKAEEYWSSLRAIPEYMVRQAEFVPMNKRPGYKHQLHNEFIPQRTIQPTETHELRGRRLPS